MMGARLEAGGKQIYMGLPYFRTDRVPLCCQLPRFASNNGAVVNTAVVLLLSVFSTRCQGFQLVHVYKMQRTQQPE